MLSFKIYLYVVFWLYWGCHPWRFASAKWYENEGLKFVLHITLKPNGLTSNLNYSNLKMILFSNLKVKIYLLFLQIVNIKCRLSFLHTDMCFACMSEKLVRYKPGIVGNIRSWEIKCSFQHGIMWFKYKTEDYSIQGHIF